MRINFSNLNSTFDTSIYKALKPGANVDTSVSIKDYVNNENSSSEFKNKVFFTDIVSGQKISVNLSDKNLNDLQNTFGTSQVKQNKDGTYELSGQAQNLVAGWFGDIAYQRGYLQADADKNGSLDANEFKNTKAGMGIDANITYQNGGISVQTQTYSYAQVNKQKNDFSSTSNNFESVSTANTISKELNNTLSKDKDKDGVLKLSELVDKDKFIKEYESAVREVLQNSLSSLSNTNSSSSSQPEYDFLTIDDFLTVDVKKMLEELQKQMKEALMKELGLTGDSTHYDLNELQTLQAQAKNSSTQNIQTSTDSTSAQTPSNLTQTDSSLTSLASSIKDNIKSNLSVDIYA